MVRDSVFQGQQVTGMNLDVFVWQMHSQSALKQLNRGSAIDMVLSHFRVWPHQNEDDVQIGVFGQCLRTPATIPPPRLPASKLSKFVLEIELERGSGQGRQPVKLRPACFKRGMVRHNRFPRMLSL